MKRRQKLLAMLDDIAQRAEEKPTDGYDRRVINFGTWNYCDAGGEPVTEYELSLADIALMRAALAALLTEMKDGTRLAKSQSALR